MFKPFGVTMQQYNVLRILKGQQGKPMTVLAITERMLDRMSNASRLVDKLLEKQLVERRQCPNDRRAVDIVILPAGLALLERMEGDLKKLGEKIEAMGNENLVQLNELLDEFRTSIF
jgi:DNA-binding MarR family transcriptional regulator